MARNEILGETSRRTFFKTIAAAGTVAAVGGTADAQAATFRLDGEIPGWMATSPAEIAGEQNPTLQLTPGQSYVVEWTNVDGAPHNFVIIDGDGNQLVRSEIISQQGATQRVTFEATQAMAEYFCEVHPGTMRGAIASGAEPPQDMDGRNIPVGPTVGIETVAGGLTAPLGFEVPAGEQDRQFVLDQTGQVYVLGPDGLAEEPFIDIANRVIELGIPDLGGYDERGLLGLAFHPNFAENRRFFLRYSAPRRAGTPQDYDHTAVLSEFTATEDLSAGNPDSERAILEVPQPQDNHNGGAIEFGPDGYLYVALGDGGAFDDVGPGHVEDWYQRNEGGNGQDLTQNLLGSILRIDVDSEENGMPYAVPDDNPLVGTDAPPEQWAWGFRNPWQMSFNDGQLFVGDAGQNLYEEVSIVERGGNYGWNVREGAHCFSTADPVQVPADCPTNAPDEPPYDGQPLIDPVIEYRHRESTRAFIDGSVVIAGYMYTNDTIPALTDKYVFGNWSGSGIVTPDGEIFVATPADEGLWSLTEARIAGTDGGTIDRYVYAMGMDGDGELYVLTNRTGKPQGETGEVHRLVPAEGQA